MGALFRSPSVPAVPPPAAPAPVAKPDTAAIREKERKRLLKGRQDTILTGARGIPNDGTGTGIRRKLGE